MIKTVECYSGKSCDRTLSLSWNSCDMKQVILPNLSQVVIVCALLFFQVPDWRLCDLICESYVYSQLQTKSEGTVLGIRKFSEKKNGSPRHTKLTDISGFLLCTAILSYKTACGHREYCPISHRNCEDSSNEVECFLHEMPQKAISNSVFQTGFKFSTVNKTCNNILENEGKHKNLQLLIKRTPSILCPEKVVKYYTIQSLITIMEC